MKTCDMCDCKDRNEDYDCEECGCKVVICPECMNIIEGCPCGHCTEGETFFES